MRRSFGKYRLLERVASGGMAEVWRAEAPGPGGFAKEVALKLIRGDHDANGEFVRLFVREARLASRLAHANVVQVFDFDQVDGRYYLAMEFVRGHTLREVLDRCRALGLRFGLPRGVHVCAEVARALAYAHQLEEGGRPAGLVHRDVSPHNVLVSFEGDVKLADFGIARALDGPDVTAPGAIRGKLAYMAPEQARGEPVDARADVFALGAILWELCTGRRLFARGSEAATLAAVLCPTPPSLPSEWNEAVPPALDALVLAALAHDRAARLGSAEELSAGLATIRLALATRPEDVDLRLLMRRLWPEGAAASRAAVLPCPEPTPVRPLAPQQASPDATTVTAARASGRRPRRRAWGAIAAAALLAAVAGGAGLRVGRRLVDRGARQAVTALASASAAAPGAAAPRLAARAPAAAAPLRSGGDVVPPVGAPVASVDVRATPWAEVSIDGTPAGETPVRRALTPGVHRLRAAHPALGVDEAEVRLQPGEQLVWRAALRR